jgi:methanogenic corrinoid protein MtbC1
VGAARRESDTRPLIVLGGAAIVDDAHAGLLGADAFAPDARSFVGLLAMR